MDGWKINENVANVTVFQMKHSLQLGIISIELAFIRAWSIYLLEGFWLILSTTHVEVTLNEKIDLTFSQIVLVLNGKRHYM